MHCARNLSSTPASKATSQAMQAQKAQTQEPESDPLNLTGYPYEMIAFLTVFKLCFYKFRHIVSQTKHAKSYN